MVGTNRSDYQAAMGLSRTFAGHGSDGLVRVENASVWGLDEQHQVTRTAATAYCSKSSCPATRKPGIQGKVLLIASAWNL